MRLLTTILILTLPAAAFATEFTISTDTPADFGTTTYLATQTVEYLDGNYSTQYDGSTEGFDPAASINALAKLEDGSILFTSDVPVELDGVFYEPRDVIEYDGSAYSLHLLGDSVGFGPSTQIDALTLLADGSLAVSFAQPTTVGTTNYMPADIARIDAGDVTKTFDSTAHGIPAGANVTAYEEFDSGDRLFSFEGPIELSGTMFVPGQIVQYNGISYSEYFTHPGYQSESSTSALSLPGSPGHATDLFLSKAGSEVRFDWSPSCSLEASDYGVYEGMIGDFGGHLPALCTTGGLPTAQYEPDTGNRFFLITANNGTFEGSYGVDATGSERSTSTAACQTQQKVRACP